jgi:tRNA(Ile2) C34 agmatinyltransferase TiaS
VTDAEVAEWLYERVAAGLPADADMGRIEKAVEAASLESRRLAAQRLVQRAADASPPKCPDCGGPLKAHAGRCGRQNETVAKVAV